MNNEMELHLARVRIKIWAFRIYAYLPCTLLVRIGTNFDGTNEYIKIRPDRCLAGTPTTNSSAPEKYKNSETGDFSLSTRAHAIIKTTSTTTTSTGTYKKHNTHKTISPINANK